MPVFSGSRRSWAQFHGVPDPVRDLVSDGNEPTTWYARPDCVLSEGRLRTLRLNIGTGTGTIDLTAAVSSRLHFATAPPLAMALDTLAREWNCTEWQADARLAAALAEFCGDRPLGLWHHDDSETGGSTRPTCATSSRPMT